MKWASVMAVAAPSAMACVVPPAHPECANRPPEVDNTEWVPTDTPGYIGPSTSGPISFCYFPDEADRAGLQNAVVDIDVFVRADGRPSSVYVKQDPGFGLGNAARQCAMEQRFVPAHDATGRPAPGRLAIRVRFSQTLNRRSPYR
jgi:hypothetical protein